MKCTVLGLQLGPERSKMADMRVSPVDGARLRELREGKRLSQRKLARLAQISRSQIQKLEAGGSAAFGITLVGLADALECSITDLVIPTDSDDEVAA